MLIQVVEATFEPTFGPTFFQPFRFNLKSTLNQPFGVSGERRACVEIFFLKEAASAEEYFGKSASMPTYEVKSHLVSLVRVETSQVESSHA